MGDLKIPNVDRIQPEILQHKNDPKVSSMELAHMQQAELLNYIRTQRMLNMQRKNRITASFLTFGVLSIYGYTMYAMKQETFLEDFEMPEIIQE